MKLPTVAFGSGFAGIRPLAEEKWIAGALKKRSVKGGKRGAGTLTAAAKRAGKSISTYCANPPSSLASKRCAMRKNLSKLGK